MAKLSYFPDSVDLHGKQKIYFACHPDDFDTYFKPVCADLLAGNRNCVVFYNSERNVPWKSGTMKFELEQMQLMVIPVTAKFLCKSSEVRDVELPFIMNNTDRKIPILPLMQESGLDTEYGQVFHDLQYLDKNASMTDPTALPYEQKLKNYLDSIIFSPELIKKIREAFDAYIFLSYRKMDRVYAQNLMKLIHENNFCRDIAIWYDEFLTPGEGFTKAIDDVLTKSDLFTLVVTPNILKLNDMGNENYVVDKEYPAAVKSGKPILPVSMQETDLDALHKKLDNAVGEDVFPTPTDGENAEALSQALQDKLPQDLLERLHAIAIDENNTDPQHNFFIGLAYLGGIDMEVDHEKAVQLITSAAEQNLPEAMEKLADMYKNGEGVTRNYETSAQWLDKLVEYWEKRFEETGAEKDGDRLYASLFEEGCMRDSMWHLSTARDFYNRAIAVAGQLEQYDNDKYKLYVAACFKNIGDSYFAGEYADEAKEWLIKAIDIWEEISVSKSTQTDSTNLIDCYHSLLDIYILKHEFREAKKLIKKSRRLIKTIYNEIGTTSYGFLLAQNYHKEGNLLKEADEIRKALTMYEKSIKLCKEMYNDKHSAYLLSEIVKENLDIAEAYKEKGNVSTAKDKYIEAIKMQSEPERKISPTERLNIGNIYLELGNVCNEDEQFDEAKEWYWKAIEAMKQYCDEIGSQKAYIFLLQACFSYIGNIPKEHSEFSMTQFTEQLKDIAPFMEYVVSGFPMLKSLVPFLRMVNELPVEALDNSEIYKDMFNFDPNTFGNEYGRF